MLKTVSTDLPDERNKVVFTHGEHFDVSHNDHLIMVLVEDGIVQHVYDTHAVQFTLWST